MVVETDGVVYVELVTATSVFNSVPPDAAEYHLKVPDVDDVADKFTVPDPHTDPPVGVGVAGRVKTLATTRVRVLTQVPLSNST